ncbi:MAG: hypothetical protein Q9195_000439 [Heterodermia aff. obscurata]
MEKKDINEGNMLCSLPREIFRMVVKSLADTGDKHGQPQDTQIRACVRDLKSLRLACRRLSGSNSGSNQWSELIRESLFKRIQLIPGQDELRPLTEIKIDKLGPFVKAVAFVAPPYSWTLTYRDFRKSPLTQTIQRHGVHNDALYAYAQAKVVPEVLHPQGAQQPSDESSRQERRVRYDEYCARALAMRQGRGLIAAWISALKALPKVDEVVIRAPRLVDQDRFYKVAAAPIGDELLTAVINVLSAAGTRVRSLKIVGFLTNEVEWVKLPAWKTLDLSRLQSFTFRPRVWRRAEELMTPGVHASKASGSKSEQDEDRMDISEDDEPLKAEIMARDWNFHWSTVDAVLFKSADNIEELKYSCLRAMHWPGMEVIHLPKLRYLSLSGSNIRAQNLATWLAQMPSLEHFRLSKASERSAFRGWLCIFNAIRNHPKPEGMRVQLDNVKAVRIMNLDYHTNDSEKYAKYIKRDIESAADVWGELDWSLGLYLSGKIRYNRCLRSYLGLG